MKTKNGIDEIYNAIHKENLRYHARLYEKKIEGNEKRSRLTPSSDGLVKSFDDKSHTRELAK